jgi:hypothetical protein
VLPGTTTATDGEGDFDRSHGGSEAAAIGGIAAGGEDVVVGRQARVLRYKEKRLTRLFSKTIRYQVRKLNAERRPRMKVSRPPSSLFSLHSICNPKFQSFSNISTITIFTTIFTFTIIFSITTLFTFTIIFIITTLFAFTMFTIPSPCVPQSPSSFNTSVGQFEKWGTDNWRFLKILESQFSENSQCDQVLTHLNHGSQLSENWVVKVAFSCQTVGYLPIVLRKPLIL